MSSEGLHVARESLSRETMLMHYSISSLMEELEAVDWYRQRADDTDDAQLKKILLHNMREEMEHAVMLIEWLRRNNADFADHCDTYLYTSDPITEVEEEDTGKKPPSGSKAGAGAARKAALTIGTMKGK